MSHHETVIKISNLDKDYVTGEGKTIPVLRGVDLEINATEFCVIIGPSGSGKSTLLHHIVGLETPSKGKVVVRGTDVSKMNAEDRATFRAGKFGMVYQACYWSKSLNVLENVALPLLIAGENQKVARHQALKSLEEIGMEGYAYKNPVQLSGGEQQRIGLARALVNNPWIIIADEPTGNLDTHSADQVMSILQNLNVHKKRTVVMVTHNLSYLPMATKQVAMRDGTIVSAGVSAVREQIKEELKGVL